MGIRSWEFKILEFLASDINERYVLSLRGAGGNGGRGPLKNPCSDSGGPPVLALGFMLLEEMRWLNWF